VAAAVTAIEPSWLLATAAPQAAGRLEVQVRPDQRVKESERRSVVDHFVLVGDESENVAGVIADVGLEPLGRDQLRGVLGAEVVGPLRALYDQYVTVRDLPAEPGLRERLVNRLRVLVEHYAEAVPRRATSAIDREHRVGVGDAVRHLRLLLLSR
jgi:hypothetical protein